MIKTADGVEIYENQIEQLFLEYFRGLDINPYKDKIENNRAKAAFMDVYEHLFMPDTNTVKKNNKSSKLDYSDIDTLNEVYRIFYKICLSCNICPFMECFSLLTGISGETLNTWDKGEYRGYIYYDMKGNVINDLQRWKLMHKGEEYNEKATTVYSDFVKKIKKGTREFNKGKQSDSDVGNLSLANNDDEIGLHYAQKEARAKADAMIAAKQTAEQIAERYKSYATLGDKAVIDA